MNDFIILTDSRQKCESHILKEFDKEGVLHIRTTLPSADYATLRHDKDHFYIDYSVLIDTKKDLEEIASNLCNTTNHERIKREIERAKELGCTKFIFLIGDNKIKSIDDLQNWTSKRTKVKGSTLLKIFSTMQKKYDIKFIITSKKNLGKYILKIFNENC